MLQAHSSKSPLTTAPNYKVKKSQTLSLIEGEQQGEGQCKERERERERERGRKRTRGRKGDGESERERWGRELEGGREKGKANSYL